VSIDIPASVTFIGSSAFQECARLTAINIHKDNTVYSSEEGVWYDKAKTSIIVYPVMKSGTSFIIPATVKKIESGAFYKSKLESVTIPNSVQEIGVNAFWLSSQLTSLTLPKSVQLIDEYAFHECTGLTDVTVEWATPLAIHENVFDKVNTSDVTLHVPKGTTALYKAVDVWKDFGEYKEYEPSGIGAIENQTLKVFSSNGALYITGLRPGETLNIYNLAGQLIYKGVAKAEEELVSLDAQGVYIIEAGG
jgi:hypothetical protein